MNTTIALWVALGLGFFGLLTYLSMANAPPAPPAWAEHNARDAEASCLDAVRNSLTDPRFPFSANVSYLGDGRYRLNGTVEAPESGESVRRNYECVVRYDGSTYRTDSVYVWQSH
jgi:hypothetical protein